MHGSSERAADVSCGCRRGHTIEVMVETKNMRNIGAASISPHMIMQLGSTHQEHKLVLYSADGSKITDQSDLQTTVEEDDGLMLLSQVRSVCELHPIGGGEVLEVVGILDDGDLVDVDTCPIEVHNYAVL